MKVELSIADDRELRSVIKDMIKGEVSSIMRGEIKNIIQELIKEDVIPKDADTLKKIITVELNKIIKEQLIGSSYNTNIIRDIARIEIAKILKDNLEKNQLGIGG